MKYKQENWNSERLQNDLPCEEHYMKVQTYNTRKVFCPFLKETSLHEDSRRWVVQNTTCQILLLNVKINTELTWSKFQDQCIFAQIFISWGIDCICHDPWMIEVSDGLMSEKFRDTSGSWLVLESISSIQQRYRPKLEKINWHSSEP